jgi:polar amino acid transport system substrate-binding protein
VFVNTVATEISVADASAEIETKFILKEAPAFGGVTRGNLDLLF